MKKGIHTFRVQVQVYHYINQLLPSNNNPTYLQLYFYDTKNELQNPLNISDKFYETTLQSLIDILRINFYSKFFRSLSNIDSLHSCQIKIRCDPGLDQRVYNAAIASQVAIVWLIRIHQETIEFMIYRYMVTPTLHIECIIIFWLL